MNGILRLALLAILLGCSSRRVERETLDPRVRVHRADMGAVTSCHLVDRIYVCSLPDAEALELAERRGVELVLDLRGPDEEDAQGLARKVRDLGMRYERIPFAVPLIDDGTVDRAMAWLTEPDRPQVLVFSESGERGAMLTAIYRSVVLRVPIPDAMEDARRCGMKPGESEVQVRRQIFRLLYPDGVETAD